VAEKGSFWCKIKEKEKGEIKAVELCFLSFALASRRQNGSKK
jgi:hypothetical protein